MQENRKDPFPLTLPIPLGETTLEKTARRNDQSDDDDGVDECYSLSQWSIPIFAHAVLAPLPV